MSNSPNDKKPGDTSDRKRRSTEKVRPVPRDEQDQADETDNSPADQTGRAEVPEKAPKSN